MARKPTTLFVPFTLALFSARAVIVTMGLSDADAPQGRRLTAVIEPQIDIELWTNAGDADLEAVLNGLDIPSLRALTQS